MTANENDDLIAGIVDSTHTIAMVGASAKPGRPSNTVMAYLLAHGYVVYPVNPGQAGGEILGQKVYAALSEVPVPCDMVNIFRPSDAAGDVAREAARLMDEKGFQVVWMQLGIENAEAGREAETAGLVVVQNRCIKIEHEKENP